MSTDLETQRNFILRQLQAYGRVSAHDLNYRHGITRSGARIYELRQAGFNIVTERKAGEMAVYRLVVPEPAQRELPW